MAYASILTAVTVYFGLDSSPFLAFFLFFSLLMTASLGFSHSRVLPVIGVASFFGVAFFSIPLLANCVMHAGLILFEKFRHRRISKKTAVHYSMICLLLSIAGVIVFGLGPYRELMRIREQIPEQNLAKRLDYEVDHVRSQDTPRVWHRLTDHWKDFELTLLGDLGTWPEARNHYLRQIHDQRVDSLVKSQGFGVGQISLFHEYDGAHDGILPDLQNVPFRGKNNQDNPAPQTFDEGNYWITPQWRPGRGPLDFHFSGLIDFLNTTTYGLMVEPRKTIGFESHGFHFSAEPVNYQNQTLLLTTLQLVSLRRFGKPRVYVLGHLPRMDQLSKPDVVTRRLNEFESRSLKIIQDNNTDVELEFVNHKLVMLGSIRAVQPCLDCHTAKRGELLGAFSYQFDQIQQVYEK